MIPKKQLSSSSHMRTRIATVLISTLILSMTGNAPAQATTAMPEGQNNGQCFIDGFPGAGFPLRPTDYDPGAGVTWGVATAENLAEIGDCAGLGGGAPNFKLLNDIDLSSYNWVPISNFNTTFDGNNYKITGLNIDNPDQGDTGLFAQATDATFKNIILDRLGNVSGDGAVGALVGRATRTYFENIEISTSDYSPFLPGDISLNVSVASYSTSGAELDNFAGGLAGEIVGGGVFSASVIRVSVASDNFAGGIAGRISATSYIDDMQTDNLPDYQFTEGFDISDYRRASSLRFVGTAISNSSENTISDLEARSTAGGLFGTNGHCYLQSFGLDDYGNDVETEICNPGVSITDSSAVAYVAGELAGGLVGKNHGVIINSRFESAPEQAIGVFGEHSGSVIVGFNAGGGLVGQQGATSNLGRSGEVLGYKIIEETTFPHGAATHFRAFFKTKANLFSSGELVQLSGAGLAAEFGEFARTYLVEQSGFGPLNCAARIQELVVNSCEDVNGELIGWFSVPINSDEISSPRESGTGLGFLTQEATAEIEDPTISYSGVVGVQNSVVDDTLVTGVQNLGGAIGQIKGGGWIENVSVTGTTLAFGIFGPTGAGCSESFCNGIGGIIGNADIEPWDFAKSNLLPTPLALGSMLSFKGHIGDLASLGDSFEISGPIANANSYVSNVGGIAGVTKFMTFYNVAAYTTIDMDAFFTEPTNQVSSFGGVFGTSGCSPTNFSTSDMKLSGSTANAEFYNIAGFAGTVHSGGWWELYYDYDPDQVQAMWESCTSKTSQHVVTQSLGSTISLPSESSAAQFVSWLTDGRDFVGPDISGNVVREPWMVNDSATVFTNWANRGNILVDGEQSPFFFRMAACEATLENLLGHETSSFISYDSCGDAPGRSARLRNILNDSRPNAFINPDTEGAWRYSDVSGVDLALLTHESAIGYRGIDLEVVAGSPVSIPLQVDRGMSNIERPNSKYMHVGELPEGLQINQETGEIFGTPTAEETVTFQIMEIQEYLQTKSAPITIAVVSRSISSEPGESPSGGSPSGGSTSGGSSSGGTQSPAMNANPPATVKPLTKLWSATYNFTTLNKSIKDKVAKAVKGQKTKMPKQVECRVEGSTLKAAQVAAATICKVAGAAAGNKVAVKPTAVVNKKLGRRFSASVKLSG